MVSKIHAMGPHVPVCLYNIWYKFFVYLKKPRDFVTSVTGLIVDNSDRENLGMCCVFTFDYSDRGF
jgi:hypothetical protein